MPVKIGICGNIHLDELATTLDARIPQQEVIVGLPGNYIVELSHPPEDFKHLDICILALDWNTVSNSWYSHNVNEDNDKVLNNCKAVCDKIATVLTQFRLACKGKIFIFSPISPPTYSTGFITRLLHPSPMEVSFSCQTIFNDMCKSFADVYPVDCEQIASGIGKDNAFSYPSTYTNNNSFSPVMITAIAEHLDAMITQCCLYPLKCLVLDCDNTLWGGIVGEAGMDNIVLSDSGIGKAYKDFQIEILKLYNQGVIVALCSKNNTCDVLETMERHPHMIIRPSMISCFRINWDDKPKNILQIAQELSIGLQSMLFVDDSPQERAMMKKALPDVEIHPLPKDPALYAHSLQHCTRFWPLQLTKEDTQKNSLYSQDKIRKETLSVAKNVVDFLLQSDIKITIAAATIQEIPRLAQLFNKTNQYNVTGARYTETDLHEILNSPTSTCLYMSMSDRYGDYGIISSCILTNTTLESFVLSCRVFGKKAEFGFMSSILALCKTRSMKYLQGHYIQTQKNAMAKDFYQNAGFLNKESHPQESWWIFDCKNPIPEIPQWLCVNNCLLFT